ncbi:MAG: STAS domain-containing protein [Planctomycetota bacterium]
MPQQAAPMLPDHPWEALEIEVDRRGKWAIVSFREPDLRSHQVQDALRRELDILQERLTVDRVVLDFDRVEHISSAALGMLLHFADELRQARKAVIAACHLSDDLDRAFDLLNAERVMVLCDSRNEALRAEEPEPKRWWWPFG